MSTAPSNQAAVVRRKSPASLPRQPLQQGQWCLEPVLVYVLLPRVREDSPIAVALMTGYLPVTLPWDAFRNCPKLGSSEPGACYDSMSAQLLSSFCLRIHLRPVGEADTYRLAEKDHVRGLIPSVRIQLGDQVFGDVARAEL